ncbi:MAG: T9SS type A sorting domain-containing protein [Armatimonadetes bacterium]|nr:T9SS type A sorting domain-containing protein [Armatimonadota bacterium]
MKRNLCVLCLFFLILFSVIYAADDWTQKSPTVTGGTLSGRSGGLMTYIGGDQTIMFGGYISNSTDETWVYKLSENTWTKKSPSPKPSARTGHGLAYISGDYVLLFGGWDGGYDGETWIYDLSENTWTEKTPTVTGGTLSARYYHSIAYIGDDQVLLFGGIISGNNKVQDTWIYDLSEDTWTIKSPSSKPSARQQHSIAYIGDDQVLLFGGSDASGKDDETWVYDLSADNWTLDLNDSQPSAREGSPLSETSMDGSSYLVLFGGFDGSDRLDDTWTFGGGDYSLPVTLSSFTVQFIDNAPILCWVTQSETSNAGWNIYRGESEEALSNEETYLLNLSLGLIPGAGTTSEPTEYSFEDFFPVYAGNTYFYWLESVDYSGETEIYGPISLSIPEYEWPNPNSPEIPKPYGLHQNYPNPFNPSTEISFMLNENCIGNLSIYNLKGQKIKFLFKNRPITKDELVITPWDGKDEFGKNISSGIYLYELKTMKKIYLKKMLLIK